jgi:hypothetical protein
MEYNNEDFNQMFTLLSKAMVGMTREKAVAVLSGTFYYHYRFATANDVFACEFNPFRINVLLDGSDIVQKLFLG